jgi:hypothetical protein
MASDGTLLELTSRGKKDAYFIQNPRRTWFGADYERRSGSTRNIIRQFPENPAQFGSWVDIELPRTADVMTRFEIRIELPSWLPPEVEALNRTHVVEIENTDILDPITSQPTKARYGWSNGIADNLIQRWELYADTLKLCEGYGVIHSVYNYSKTTHSRAPILHAAAGYHDGSSKMIQRNATPTQLTCRIPVPGCQWEGAGGLPICAMLQQRLYIRLYIAPKTAMVESTALYIDEATKLPVFDPCPAPWGNKRIFINGSAAAGYRTLREWQIGQPYLYASCTVVHLEEELRNELMRRPIELPYHKYLLELLNFDERSWQVGNQIVKHLETKGFYDALYVRFWHDARMRQNKYRDTLAPGGFEWVSKLSLVINGRERVATWDPKKLRQLANNTQLQRDIHDPLYYLIFGEPVDHEPAGTLYLSRTHKAQLNFTVENLPIDPATRSKYVYVYLLGVAWNILDIRDGQAKPRFLD